jgi:hypothetical protein
VSDMFSHVLCAMLCKCILMGSMLHWWCNACDVVKSSQRVFVMNRSALFWTVCNLDMDVRESVCRGMGGYVSTDLTMDL